jgi:hypothetical protein
MLPLSRSRPDLRARLRWLGAGAFCLLATSAGATSWRLGATELLVGGRLTGTFAPRDRAYFNASDYGTSTLRQVRVTLDLEWRLAARLALVAQGRSRNAEHAHFSALYLRARPFARVALDVQAGRVPPVFGAFGRRGYGDDDTLVGLPLPFQYPTTLRADGQPASADQLLLWRGGGWLTAYNGLAPRAGLPLMQGDQWDTGLELRWAPHERVELAAALTRGTLAAPRLRDDNDGRQFSARLQARPRFALTLGLSVARGPFRARGVPGDGGSPRDLQQAWGADAEWSHGPWVLRAEALRSRFDVPAVAVRPLGAWGALLEVRHRLAPGLDLATRGERLAFDTLAGTRQRASWDASLWRLETGLAWSPRRGLRLKLACQQNWRQAVFLPRQTLLAAQVGVWF